MTTPILHIPYIQWADDPTQTDKYCSNMQTIQGWANDIRCTGRTNGPDWETRKLHLPYLNSFGFTESFNNYLTLERWSKFICKPLHIPFKRWWAKDDQSPLHERVNLLTIQRWARSIGPC